LHDSDDDDEDVFYYMRFPFDCQMKPKTRSSVFSKSNLNIL
jgi:hypothetical protein